MKTASDIVLMYLLFIAFGYTVYKFTKIGLIQDAINFIKYDLFKKKKN